jgi:hypothetical protein
VVEDRLLEYVPPDAKGSPPVSCEYQLIVPADEVAVKVTFSVLQKLFVDALVIIGLALTVAITGVLEAVVHPLNVAST